MPPKRQSSIKTRLTRQPRKPAGNKKVAVEQGGPMMHSKSNIKKHADKKKHSTIDIDKKDTSDLLKELVPPRPMEVHQENLSETDKQLRGFDLNYKYGPCVGLTRLERWERAESLGLDPPQEIKTILLKDKQAQECLFYGNVI